MESRCSTISAWLRDSPNCGSQHVLHQPGLLVDRGQGVVDLVRDPGGELAHRGQLGRMTQLRACAIGLALELHQLARPEDDHEDAERHNPQRNEQKPQPHTGEETVRCPGDCCTRSTQSTDCSQA